MTHSSIAASLVVLLASLTYIADEPFKITTKRSDDRIEVKSKNDKPVFIVRSPFGISNATIELTKEQWPDKVVIQLRLQGLESFKVSTDMWTHHFGILRDTFCIFWWQNLPSNGE
jgi:uncharacterized glyoxalase superfamily protein PhnB